MNKAETNSVKVTATLTPSLDKAWRKTAEAMGIPQVELIRIALQREIDRQESKQAKKAKA